MHEAHGCRYTICKMISVSILSLTGKTEISHLVNPLEILYAESKGLSLTVLCFAFLLDDALWEKAIPKAVCT